MQTELNYYDEEEDQIHDEGLECNRELSKQIRDYSYKKIINDVRTDNQCNIIHNIIMAHPEGITDLEICIFTGISRSSVTARRNEIPSVVPIGIAKITDDVCSDRLNTLWGIDNEWNVKH